MAAAVDSAVTPPVGIPRPPDRYRTFTAFVSWAAPASLILIIAVLEATRGFRLARAVSLGTS